MSRTKTRPRVFSHASLRPPVRRHCSGKNVPRVRSTPSTPGGIPRVSAAGGPLRVSPDKMRKPPPSNPVLYPAPGCALRALSSAEGDKLIFWEKCGFIGVHEGLCLEHEGTTIDAAGGRVPPASHGTVEGGGASSCSVHAESCDSAHKWTPQSYRAESCFKKSPLCPSAAPVRVQG